LPFQFGFHPAVAFLSLARVDDTQRQDRRHGAEQQDDAIPRQ
jgi:hypothetical protein